MAEAKYKKSKSGYYKVALDRVWEHEGFRYKPSQDVTVNESILLAMLEDGVAKTITPAD
jgi:hypothetical protein